MYPKSGFKTISGVEFLNALALLHAKRISFRCFRVYIASIAIVAVREAAKRAQLKKGRGPSSIIPRYEFAEWERLCGATRRQIQSDLKRLRESKLLFLENGILSSNPELLAEAESFQALVRSPKRPVPVPRAVLRFLALEKRQSLSKTMIAYMLRGLSISRRDAIVSGRGSAKLSSIANLASISERSARYARRKLVELGWIARDTGSKQWKLNRDGAYFSIHLDWEPPRRVWRAPRPRIEFAPRNIQNTPQIAAPYKDRKTPYGSKNQKASFTGVSKTKASAAEGEIPPSFSNIKMGDLHSISRCESLYWQAVEAKYVPHSESNALNFLAAAVRARSIEKGDSSRVFVAIVKRGLWKNITLDQEEVARRGLCKARDNNPGAFRYSKPCTVDRMRLD